MPRNCELMQFFTAQVAGQDTMEITMEVQKLIIVCHEEKTRNELMTKLGLKGRDNFGKLYLQPDLKENIIEMTIPDKPNSRLQKYRLTGKGVEVQRNLKGLRYE